MNKSYSINFSPKMGYFLSDNLVVGFDLPFWYLKKIYGDSEIAQTLFAAGPFARYYFGKGRVFPFAVAEAIFGQVKTKSSSDAGSSEDKTSIQSYCGGIGATFLVTPKIY